MHPPTIHELRIFVTVAKDASFTNAARSLGVTQPALSMAIRQFEEKLGAAVFDRNTRSVRLSPLGEQLMAAAERQVENFDKTVSAMQEVAAGKSSGHIVIACPEGVAAHVLAPLISEFSTENPSISFSLQDGDATSVAREVHARTAELAITGYWDHDPGFVFEPFTRDRVCVICPNDHPLADRETLSFHELDGLAIASLNRDSGVRTLIEKVAANLGTRLSIQFEVARVSTLIEMVATGLCVSVLPYLALPFKAAADLRAVPIEGPEMSYDIGVVYSSTRSLSPPANRFLQLLRKRYRSNDQLPQVAWATTIPDAKG